MPKSLVFGAGVVLAAAALAGLYGGASRVLTAPAGAEETPILTAPAAPVASAKPMVAATTVMDEATVRKLAREEAQAVLARPAAKKADDGEDEENAAASMDAPSDTPTVPLVSAKPAVPAPGSTPQ